MVSLIVVILIFILSFIVPQFYPYKYEQQIKGSNSLAPFEYSQAEQEAIANGRRCSRIFWERISWDETTLS